MKRSILIRRGAVELPPEQPVAKASQTQAKRTPEARVRAQLAAAMPEAREPHTKLVAAMAAVQQVLAWAERQPAKLAQVAPRMLRAQAQVEPEVKPAAPARTRVVVAEAARAARIR